MYKIGIIGQRDRISCFMAAGFSVYDASDSEQASEALKRAKSEKCAVIYIVPELCEGLSADIDRLAGDVLPAVIPLPESGGGHGIRQMSRAVERAVGADIIFKER